MKVIRRFLVGFSLLLTMQSLVLAAGPVIDQQQPTINATVGGIAIGWASEQKLAQVVTTGISGSLIAVRLPVACSYGNLTVEIQRVTIDTPDGVVWTSEVIPAASLPSFYPGPPDFRTIFFSTPVFFSVGARFAIVLASSGGCGIFQGPAGNPYPGGDGFFDSRPNPIGWVRLGEFGPADLPFQTLVDPLVLVSIDLKPGGSPNSVNPRSHGVIPVAILSDPGFDATTVDPLSVRFGTGGAMPAHGTGQLEDVNGDGRLDLVLDFWTQESGIACGDTSVTLTGKTLQGQAFSGSDSLVTVGCR